MTRVYCWILPFLFLIACTTATKTNDLSPLVLMTDFSLRDGAVSEIKGVAYQVHPALVVSDLTHEISPFNIWEGAYRLNQAFQYWPAGTVFVAVVDPGVGSERRSIVARTKTGHYFVGPDNGLFTLIDDEVGIDSVRVVDEAKQRLKGSEDSNTFHGRDLYGYVGARLAAQKISFDEVGKPLTSPMVRLSYQRPEFDKGILKGTVPALDINYGNVWSNIPKKMVDLYFPAKKQLTVSIFKNGKRVYEEKLPVEYTFSSVPKGKPLLYFNSLMNLSLALNMGNFSSQHRIASGPDWTIEVR